MSSENRDADCGWPGRAPTGNQALKPEREVRKQENTIVPTWFIA